MNSKLSTQPYKGSRDFYPDEMKIRNFIFDTWKKICRRYGYEEYDGPFLEPFELYAAKSGEEIVNEQLYFFEDRGKRKIAIRPEMTPTLARMVASKFKTLPHPIRWFSIPNLWRYENPQKGRLREHYQLNVDIFGIEGIEADYEVISLALDIMFAFGAQIGQFEIRIGNRRLIDDVYKSLEIPDEKTKNVGKALDKKNKISQDEFIDLLQNSAKLSPKNIEDLKNFLENPQPLIEKLYKEGSKGAKEVLDLLKLFQRSGNSSFVRYDPTIMRGFDYYTGNVFEQFDLTPNHTRAMYGGGRYDDLVTLFINERLPGVGFGMGDVTFKNFLENWNLLPKFASDTEYLVTLWPAKEENYRLATNEAAKKLRELGKNVAAWVESGVKLDKQLKWADKKGISYCIILGEEELGNGNITIKELKTGDQQTKTLEEFLSAVS